jgi:hypothetical protein
VDLVHYTLREEKQTAVFYLQLSNCIPNNFDYHCVCLNVLTAKEGSLPQYTFPFVIAILPEDGRQKRPKRVAEEK